MKQIVLVYERQHEMHYEFKFTMGMPDFPKNRFIKPSKAAKYRIRPKTSSMRNIPISDLIYVEQLELPKDEYVISNGIFLYNGVEFKIINVNEDYIEVVRNVYVELEGHFYEEVEARLYTQLDDMIAKHNEKVKKKNLFCSRLFRIG